MTHFFLSVPPCLKTFLTGPFATPVSCLNMFLSFVVVVIKAK